MRDWLQHEILMAYLADLFEVVFQVVRVRIHRGALLDCPLDTRALARGDEGFRGVC